jgi:hypothetical protein
MRAGVRRLRITAIIECEGWRVLFFTWRRPPSWEGYSTFMDGPYRASIRLEPQAG